MRNISFWLLITFFVLSPGAFSADVSACMECHADGEFSGMNITDMIEDIRDPGIPPHKQFSDVSDDDLKAIAAKLVGS